MECFGTTDFDNNSRLITLSAIIIAASTIYIYIFSFSYIYSYLRLITVISAMSRSQWPRGLRRRSAASRLLRSWVRIPSGRHGCLAVVNVVSCQVELSATS